MKSVENEIYFCTCNNQQLNMILLVFDFQQNARLSKFKTKTASKYAIFATVLFF